MTGSAVTPDAKGPAPHDEAVRAHFRAQAEACRSLGSPFTAGLLDSAAEKLTADTTIGAEILRWQGAPRDDALALRFAAGLHWLALCDLDPDLTDLYSGGITLTELPSSWERIERALQRNAPALMKFIQGPPQTNEVGRAGVLFGGFMAVAARTGLPLSLREIGSSAGLNLNWHRYGYAPEGLDLTWGDIGGPVVLRPDWTGPAPIIADVQVTDALGCDLNPARLEAVGVEDPTADEAKRLLAYIWPDQIERLDRMRGALAVARDYPPKVERASAAAWLREVLPKQEGGTAQVLFHSIVWQYLPQEERDGIRAAIDQTAASAEKDKAFAWLRMEPSASKRCAELRLSIWPDAQELHLADVCYHGNWVRWLGAE